MTQHVSYRFGVSYALLYSHFVVMVTDFHGCHKTTFAVVSGSHGYDTEKYFNVY